MYELVITISVGQIYLTTVCKGGAKCFLAYSSGILDSTIDRKSRPIISDVLFVDLEGEFIHAFANVRSVKFTGEVQEVLYIIAESHISAGHHTC